jgi:hypothetical protein
MVELQLFQTMSENSLASIGKRGVRFNAVLLQQTLASHRMNESSNRNNRWKVRREAARDQPATHELRG